jgi:hypothetical protein
MSRFENMSIDEIREETEKSFKEARENMDKAKKDIQEARANLNKAEIIIVSAIIIQSVALAIILIKCLS